jgi:hypothetical protein
LYSVRRNATPLTPLCGPQHREDPSRNAVRLPILTASKDFPPVATSPVPLRLPFGYYLINQPGDVGITIPL